MKTLLSRRFSGRGTSTLTAVLLALLVADHAFATVRYVWQNSPSPAPPYTNWTTAAHVIQDAVDAAQTGDTVRVAGGVYATGGRAVYGTMTNRVAIGRAITVESLMGPEVTTIQGYQVPGTTNGDGAIRCVYLTNGASLSGFTLTNGATRAVDDYLTNRERSGGGVWCESTNAVMSNCMVVGNSAFIRGGGAYGGTLNHCVLTGNSAGRGGGAASCTLNNCTLIGNSAEYGGGASWCMLYNCTLTGNSAIGSGGGTLGGTLYHCTLTGNSASAYGGGAYDCSLNNCTLTGNSAADSGGGAFGGTLYNCSLNFNSARWGGGGATGDYTSWGLPPCELYNCTLTGNSAGTGGGAYFATLNNCILYFNTAPVGANYGWSILNYCCTTPLPVDGTDNITLDPQLASASYLSATSPCRGAGSAAYTTGVDIDGEAWASPPSIGCDEYHAGAVTGPLSVGIAAAYTNVAVGFTVELTAFIDGRATASVWEFGDGVVVSNRPYATHAWAAPGAYTVVLRAYNDSHPEGASATVTIHVVQAVHHVAVASANPVPPYTNWATAATRIQDAVDAATLRGALVLVTNGVYASGGRAVVGMMTNRVAVDKLLRLRSVNGPQFTMIQGAQASGGGNGDGAIRCAYLADGASLSGFTLTNGATRSAGDYDQEQRGGGVWCESEAAVVSNCVVAGNSACDAGGGACQGTLNHCTLTGNAANGSDAAGGGACFATLNNCTLTGNSAHYGGGVYDCSLNNCTVSGNAANGSYAHGGGAWGGTLNHCTVSGNAASREGGGASSGTLYNCTLTGNAASREGGGASGGTLYNCLVYFNTAPAGANYRWEWTTLNHCCTTPLPTNGVGNITNAPLFVDYAGGNLRLQSNSPCINAGNNSSLTNYYDGFTNLFDLDGLPRLVSGTVDIGAYEFQGTGSVISYAWLQHYGLPTDGAADFADPDADGHTTWQEWRCLTDPTNALSGLRLLSATPAGTNVTVSWQSVAGVNYFLERSTNLGATPPFILLVPNLPGQPGTTSFTDTNAAPMAPLFYRVGVGN